MSEFFDALHEARIAVQQIGSALDEMEQRHESEVEDADGESARLDRALCLTEEALKDERKRLATAQRLLLGADFAWGDPPQPVVILRLPPGLKIGADLTAFLDAAAEAP